MTGIHDRLQQALGAAYRIERELGGGGMSHVFLAEEVALGRRVVVKVLPQELAAGVSADRFRREIQLAAQLQHPGIVPLMAAGIGADLLWYSMPFVEGESLRTRLARGPLPIDEAVRLWRDLLEALEYAHGRGIVHRDIKPENIMLTGRRAVTLDFGVAKAVSASTAGVGSSAMMTGVGFAIGTPAYMAPEQAAGDGSVDARADLYAAGLVLYEMLAGRGPFDARTPAEHMAAHIATAPAPLPVTVPAPLRAIVEQCLCKSPSERPASAALTIAMVDAANSSGPQPVAAQIGRPRRRAWRIAGAVAIVVAAIGGGAFWRMQQLRALGTQGFLADTSRLGVILRPPVYTAGDSGVAAALSAAQYVELAKDRRLSVPSAELMARLRREYGIVGDTMMRDFARDAGVRAYVMQSVTRAGAGYLLASEARTIETDSVLFRRELVADAPSQLPAQFTQLAKALHDGLASAVGKIPVPSPTGRALATTPQAARLFFEALRLAEQRDISGALRTFRLAVQVDSTFSFAWMQTGFLLDNGGLNRQESHVAFRHAFEHRDRLPSPLQRDLMASVWYSSIGENDSAKVITQRILARDEDNGEARNNLSIAYRDQRQFELALPELQRISERTIRSGEAGGVNRNLASNYLELGRPNDALRVADSIESVVQRGHPVALAIRLSVAAGIHDLAGVRRLGQQQFDAARSDDQRHVARAGLLQAMAIGGQFDSARVLNNARLAYLRTNNFASAMAQTAGLMAQWRSAMLGEPQQAMRELDATLSAMKWDTLPALDRSYVTVITANALGGRLDIAKRQLADWERTVPAAMRRSVSIDMNTARGEIALAEKRPADALRAFRAADSGRCVVCGMSRMASAHDAMGQADSAIVWYERYVYSTQVAGLVHVRQLPTAYRRLGELYEAKGDTKRAIQRYGDFIELWENADNALQPAVKDARERIARLQKKTG